MPKITELVRRVYRYEQQITVESGYLSNVLLLLSVVVLAINTFNNSLSNPGLYIFCLVVSIGSVALALYLRKVHDVSLATHIASAVFLLFGLSCLYFGANDGFQTLWFFLFPFVLLIHIGLQSGVPYCFFYGLGASVFFWTPLHERAAYPYTYDFCFYYPVFYWSFFWLVLIADLFYKSYRIEQEKSERALEQEVADTVHDAQKLILHSVTAISRMIDEKDSYTRQHSQRVAEYSRLIAENMPGSQYTAQQLDDLYRSALLHDIGKIAIPDAILKKTSRLTDEEYALMKTHPAWGRKILDGLEFLPGVALGAGFHHERYDGKGYPNGISTRNLPETVRIIGAADALDAMNSNRCYRKHCNRDYILGELRKGSGTQFDPKVAEVVIQLIENGKIKIDEEAGEGTDK